TVPENSPMADKLVTLARYYDIVEAQLVKNHLESEGIPVYISGDTTVGMLGFGGATVELLVADEQLRRAQYLLYLLQARDDDDEMAEAEKPASLPGDEVRGASKAIQAAPPVETRLATAPDRHVLDNDPLAPIPNLRLENEPREFTWLTFWNVLMLQ